MARTFKGAHSKQSDGTTSWRADGYENHQTGIGARGRDSTVATTVVADVMSAREGLNTYRADPVGARIIDLPPGECTRQGFKLLIGDSEPPESYDPETDAKPKGTPREDGYVRALGIMHPSTVRRRFNYGSVRLDAKQAKPLTDEVASDLKRIHFISKFKHAWQLSRAGGQAALLLGAIDGQPLSEPLDIARVNSFSHVTVLEPDDFEIAYYYDDPYDDKYMEAAVYRYMPGLGVSQGQALTNKLATPVDIHESRMIVLSGPRVTRDQYKPDSIFVRLARDLAMYHMNHQSVAVMLSRSTIDIYNIPGLAQMMQKRGMQVYTEILASIQAGISMLNAVVLDEKEKLTRLALSLAGIPEVLRESAIKLSASTGIPMPLLTGVSPGGLVSAGDSEVRNFYDSMAVLQGELVAPALIRAVDIFLGMRGYDSATTARSVEFMPLWQPTQKEIGEARKLQMEVDKGYYDMQALSSEEIAWNRFGGSEFGYATVIDWRTRREHKSMVAPVVSANPAPDIEPIPDTEEQMKIPDADSRD